MCFSHRYVWMTRVLPLIGEQAVKVLDTHDVFSTKGDKVLSFGIDDLSLSRDEEAKKLALADIVIAIQQDEHHLLQKLVPDTVVVTAGVDFDMAGTMRLPSDNRVLYIASSNAMNVHGLKEFLRLGWSAVVERVPDAELVVAGAIGRAVRDDAPRVTRIGTVGDLSELYRSVRVVINPARAGTGAKIKTIEALSHLRPVVTFPAGVDGLPF